MDNFNEQIVERVNKPVNLIIKILSVFALAMIPVIGAVLGIAINLYIFTVSIFLFAFGVYAVWYIFTSQKVEYEYSVSSGELDVSKVMSKRRRKAMCSIKIREIENFGKGEKIIDNLKLTKVYEAAHDIDKESENYYAVFKSPAFGTCALIFTPNEQILKGMKPYLKMNLRV